MRARHLALAGCVAFVLVPGSASAGSALGGTAAPSVSANAVSRVAAPAPAGTRGGPSARAPATSGAITAAGSGFAGGDPGGVTVGPLMSGTTAYVHGTLVYTGYAYNDTGPNTDGSSPGAATYPSSVPRGNGANLIQLQLASQEGGGLGIRAVLETLLDPRIPLLGVGFDTDSNTRTGAPSVPGGQWPALHPLGLDYFVTLAASGAHVMRWANGAWTTVATVPASVSTATQTMTTVIPGAMLPAQTGTWRAVGVLGLALPGSTWLDGSGPIYDLAFVRGEAPFADGGNLVSAEEVAFTGSGHATGGQWQDRTQASILHGTGDSNAAVAAVDFASMRGHATTTPNALSPGYHTWMYRSAVNLGGGIVDGTAAGGLWAGPYQPYLVQVPARVTAAAPLIVYYHGGGTNHLDNNVFAPEGPLDQGAAIVLYPFGREFTTANDHGYQGASERDVVDALDDMEAHYPVDRRHVLSVGTSTGGAAAYRMAQLYPDRFAGALILSAYDDTHLEENVSNEPLAFVNGIADPAANQGTLTLSTEELDQLGDVAYMSYSALAHTHADTQAALSQCVLTSMLAQPAVVDPAHVVYGVDPSNEYDEIASHLVVLHSGAYWVSGLVTRPGLQPNSDTTNGRDTPGYGNAAVARIDATSTAMAVRTAIATAVNTAGQNVSQGADYCGASTTQTDDVWRIHGQKLSAGPPQPTSNGFTATLAGFQAASFDLLRMGIATGAPVAATLSGDGATTIGLIGPWRTGERYTVSRDGVAVQTVRSIDGVLSFSGDLSGTHTYTVTPA